MRCTTTCLLGMVVTMMVTPPAHAQQSSYRQPVRESKAASTGRNSFWIGGGLGSAYADLSCGICVEDAKSVMSAYLRAGLTLTPRLLLGLEGTGATNSEDGINERFTGLSVVAYAYPTTSGFFLKGGLGLMSYKADDDVDQLTAQVLDLQVGAGYEVRVARNIALLGFANLLTSANGNLDFNGSRVTGDARLTLLQIGLGVTYR